MRHAGPPMGSMRSVPRDVSFHDSQPTGCSSACFDAEPAMLNTSFSYVGESRGSYQKVQDYSYVGPNAGAWEKQTSVLYYGWRVRKSCLGLAACLALTGLVCAVLLASAPETSERPNHSDVERVIINTPAPSRVEGLRLAAPFDCQEGYFNWVKAWSPEKRDYCCEKQQRGCAPPTPEPAPSLAFDCHAGLATWVTGWSPAKKKWCCEEHNLACHLPTPPPDPFNCRIGLETWRTAWTPPKKAWCCENHHVGCPDAVPFDCNADLGHWQQSWPPPKKLWCCKHKGLGCTLRVQAPVPVPAPAPPPPPQTTPQITHPPVERATPPPTTSLPYDCAAGLVHWEHGWSPSKKKWCCAHTKRGCPPQPPATTSKPYDCAVDFTTCYHCLVKRWSTSKRQWCCHHEGRGCETTSTTRPFDCTAGLENAERGWSPAKKDWCCKNGGTGCPAASEGVQEQL